MSDCDELSMRRFFRPAAEGEVGSDLDGFGRVAYWTWSCACGAEGGPFDSPLQAIDAARPHYRRKR